MFFATPFVFVQRQRRRKIYLETIEGSFPLFSAVSSCWKLTVGDVRPELTFSLVLTPRIVTDPFGRSKPHVKKSFTGYGRAAPSVGVHAFRRAFRSFAAAQNDPKKRTHITGAQVLVHISCAERNATVTSILTPVAACIKSLSQ